MNRYNLERLCKTDAHFESNSFDVHASFDCILKQISRPKYIRTANVYLTKHLPLWSFMLLCHKRSNVYFICKEICNVYPRIVLALFCRFIRHVLFAHLVLLAHQVPKSSLKQ